MLNAKDTNTTIYKAGSSSYLTSGKIKIVADEIVSYGVEFSKMIKTDIYATGGDSGGVVYGYIKKSYIKKLGNYNNINYINISYDISEEELNQRIGDILESYDELVQVSDLKVDSDDIISIDIKITNKDDIIYQEKDILLNMKNFSYDEELKNYIIGCKVEKDYKFQWKVPKEQQYEDIAGNMVDVYLFINSIYEYIQYDLNDEFVVQKLGYKNTSEFVND
ncbi:MAG: hypothetical protein IJC76_03165 [Lachnospiraceae bacterium]|nr:hypothetical protein [Lachnospiraceae bacterium]